jgi:hypothetical protein
MREYAANFSPNTKWVNAGSITAASTALAVAGRDVVTADATGSTKVVILTPPNVPGGVPKAILLRVRTDGTENDSNVIDVLAARGSDHYNRIATLTTLQGKQAAATGIYFADTYTPSNEDGLFDGEESNLTDYIGHYYFRTLGFDRFLFQVTTLDSSTTTVYIDWCGIYE